MEVWQLGGHRQAARRPEVFEGTLWAELLLSNVAPCLPAYKSEQSYSHLANDYHKFIGN